MVANNNARRISLDLVQIASPCSADWNAMQGDDRARHCRDCNLTVYNLSEWTRDEAEAFLAQREGRVCARLYQRADGTVITRDCPVGLADVRAQFVRLSLATIGLLLAFAALALAALGKIPWVRPYVAQSRSIMLFERYLHPYTAIAGDICLPNLPPIIAPPPDIAEPPPENAPSAE